MICNLWFSAPAKGYLITKNSSSSRSRKTKKNRKPKRNSRSRLTAIVCPDTDIDTRILRYSESRILPMAATLIGELTFYRYCSGTMQICAPKNGSPDIMTRGEHSLCVSPKANSNIFVFAARLCALTDLRGNKSRSVYYIYIDIYIYSPTPTPTHYKFLSQYLSGNV